MLSWQPFGDYRDYFSTNVLSLDPVSYIIKGGWENQKREK